MKRFAPKPLYDAKKKRHQSLALVTWLDILYQSGEKIASFLTETSLGESHRRLLFLTDSIRRENLSFLKADSDIQYRWLASINWYTWTWYNFNGISWIFPINIDSKKLYGRDSDNKTMYIYIHLHFSGVVDDGIDMDVCKATYYYRNNIEERNNIDHEIYDCENIEFDPRAILTNYVRYSFSTILWIILQAALRDLLEDQETNDQHIKRSQQFLLEQQQIFFKTIGAFSHDVYCQPQKVKKGDKNILLISLQPIETLCIMSTVFCLPDLYDEKEKKHSGEILYPIWKQMLKSSTFEAIQILQTLLSKELKEWTLIDACQCDIFLVQLFMCHLKSYCSFLKLFNQKKT